MIKKATILILVLCILLQVPFLTVGASTEQSAAIKVWGSEIGRENDILRELAAEFKQQYGIEVEIIDRRSLFDAPKDFVNNARLADAPDIVMMQHADIGDLAVNGFLYETEFSDCIKESFHPSAFSSFNVHGRSYGIGYSIETYGLIYNKEYVDYSMLSDMTWSSFFEFAKSFNKDGVKGFLLNPKNMYFTYPIIKNYGGYYYGLDDSGDYNASDIGLGSEYLMPYVEVIKDLKDNNLVLEYRNCTDNDVSAAFANRQAGVIINGFWQNSFYKSKDVDFGIAPLPKNDDGSASMPFATINGFVINAFSDNASKALMFLEYVCEDANQLRLIQAGNNYEHKSGSRFPVNLYARNSSYIMQDPLYSAMAVICENVEPVPNIPEGDIWYNYTDKAFQSIFYGDINGEEIDAAAMLDELSLHILKDVEKMNVQIDEVEISFWGYFFLCLALLIIAGLVVVYIIRKRRKISSSASSLLSKTTLFSYLALLPVLVLMGIFYLFPIFHNIYLSATNYSSLNLVDYVFVGGHNYKNIFSEGLHGFASMFIWTMLFAISVMALTFVTGTFMAVLLEKRNVKVSKVYKMIFILPWIIPSVIMMLSWKGILATDGGPINNLLQILGIASVPWLDHPMLARISSIFVVSWMGTPYYMFLASGYITTIPKDFYEAAMIEGASKAKAFVSITLPLIFRALLPSLIMGFIMQFNNFGIYLLTSGGPFGSKLGAPGATDLLITYVYNLAYNTKQYSLAAAYSVIIFIFVGAFSLIAMRAGKKGLDDGR